MLTNRIIPGALYISVIASNIIAFAEDPNFQGTIRIPVQWETTRNEFKGGGAASLTETFRQIWTFQFRNLQRGVISSPQHEVPFSSIPRDFSKKSNLPAYIVIEESNFCQLIGLPNIKKDPESERLPNLIIIPMKAPTVVLDDFTFRHSLEESYTVRLLFN